MNRRNVTFQAILAEKAALSKRLYRTKKSKYAKQKKKGKTPTKKRSKKKPMLDPDTLHALAHAKKGHALLKMRDGSIGIWWSSASDTTSYIATPDQNHHQVPLSEVEAILTDEEAAAFRAPLKRGAIVEVTVQNSAGSGATTKHKYIVTALAGDYGAQLTRFKTNEAVGWAFLNHLKPQEMKVKDKAVIDSDLSDDNPLTKNHGNLAKGDFVEIKKIYEQDVEMGPDGPTKKVVLVDLECLVTGEKGTVAKQCIRFFDKGDQEMLDATLVEHRRVLESSRQRLLEQDALIKQLLRKPTNTTCILKIHREGPKDEKSWVLLGNGQIQPFPIQFEVENGVPLVPGMVVSLAQTGNIEAPAKIHDERTIRGYVAEDQKGDVVYCSPIDPNETEKKDKFMSMLPVYCGVYSDLKAGDQVRISKDGMVVERLAHAQPKQAALPKTIERVSWDDIGGAEKAKKELIEAIETPRKHPALFKSYGSNVPKGVELFGPPGCGKTLVAKACVTMMAELHGSAVVHESAFIYVKGPEILDKYVGEAESKIRKMFADAREHYKKNDYKAILFIDEADAVLCKRGSMRSSDVDKTIVPMFLAEMDGMDTGGPFLLLATNMPNNLDEAVIRPGRIDRSIAIPRPDVAASYDIFRVHLRKVPLASDLSLDAAAKAATIHLFDHTNHCKKEVSGAMIANVVQRAAMAALAQDIKAGRETPTGVTIDDMTSAMAEIDVAGESRKQGGKTADAHA